MRRWRPWYPRAMAEMMRRELRHLDSIIANLREDLNEQVDVEVAVA